MTDSVLRDYRRSRTSEAWTIQELRDPEQRVRDESRSGAWIYQSRLRFEDGKMYLLRVVVAEGYTPPVIVTVYKTSKIEKYWSAE